MINCNINSISNNKNNVRCIQNVLRAYVYLLCKKKVCISSHHLTFYVVVKNKHCMNSDWKKKHARKLCTHIVYKKGSYIENIILEHTQRNHIIHFTFCLNKFSYTYIVNYLEKNESELAVVHGWVPYLYGVRVLTIVGVSVFVVIITEWCAGSNNKKNFREIEYI